MERRRTNHGRPARPAHLPRSTETCGPDAGYPDYGHGDWSENPAFLLDLASDPPEELPTVEGEHGTITISPDGIGGFVQEDFVPDGQGEQTEDGAEDLREDTDLGGRDGEDGLGDLGSDEEGAESDA